MRKLLQKLLFLFHLYFVCSSIISNRNLEEEEEIDECIEFIVDLIPTRLENLEEPLDFSKDILPLGYYQPRYKYGYKLCKEDDSNDCVLKYSDNESYTISKSDGDYKIVSEKYELHGKSLYRMNSYVFKYKSVKLRLNEGLNEDGNSCKEGYKICGKFNYQFKPYTILCFPEEYECPYKNIKGSKTILSSQFTNYIKIDDGQYLNYARFTEDDYILVVFTGFMFTPLANRDNLDLLPFSFTNRTASRYESVFNDLIDMRELFKENNIYSYYLDFHLKNTKLNSNGSYNLYLNTRFQNIWDIEKKCNVKKEPREEYEWDLYDDDCITMIENIYPTKININDTEKIYEKDVFRLAYYEPKYKYEHFLCKANSSECKYEYTDNATYQEKSSENDYELINSTYIYDTKRPVYIFQELVYKYDKLNIHLKDSFDNELYSCKEGYKACARIKHHPSATLLCVPEKNSCPFKDIDSNRAGPYYKELYPYTFGYGKNISFSYSRYEQKDTLNYITKGLYLKNGISNFNEVFPFYLGTSYKGLRDITAYQNREYSLEKIFTENGIPTNYVKFYYPNVYDGKTKMFLNAEVQQLTDLELKCEEESSSNNEVILYAVWKDPKPPITDSPYPYPFDDYDIDDDGDYFYYYPNSSTKLNLSVLLLLASIILL